MLSDFACPNLTRQQQFELVPRVRHPRRETIRLPSFYRRGSTVSGTAVVALRQEGPERLLQLRQRKARFGATSTGVSIQITQEHLVDGSEETLNPSAPAGLARDRKEKAAQLSSRRFRAADPELR
jgi:hypothetical protein